MTQKIRVLQHTFEISREFLPGHVLDETEAAAMNQLLIENVRTNVASWVVRAAQGQGVLSEKQHQLLSARIEEYAQKYRFKSKPRTRVLNPFDATVRELAWQYADAWGAENGFDTDSEEVRKRYIQLRLDKTLHDQARDIVLRRQSAANKALVGLL